MKKIERGTIKYLVFLIILTALFGFILYPLFDYIGCKLFLNNEFFYSVSKHIIRPLIFGIIYGVTCWSLDKKKK